MLAALFGVVALVILLMPSFWTMVRLLVELLFVVVRVGLTILADVALFPLRRVKEFKVKRGTLKTVEGGNRSKGNGCEEGLKPLPLRQKESGGVLPILSGREGRRS